MPAVRDNQKKSFIKYFRNGMSIDMSFESKTDKFNSYREWRESSNYTQIQNERLVDLISSNSKLFKYSECISNLHKCLEVNISPNDILISMLYLSCHHFSPHSVNIIKYILTNYNSNINLYVTSISSPQFMVPHIAAMNGSISLLQIYYNLNGDINVADCRGVLPITVCIAERYLEFCELLLWMNSSIPIKQLTLLNERSNHDVAPFIAAFINFINIIDLSKQYIKQNIINIPNELIHILINYTLPINAYNGIKELLEKFKNNKLSEWHQIKQIALKKLKEKNINTQYDMENKSVVTIGIDYENDLDSMKKMVSKIYIKPTRKEGVVQYRDYRNNLTTKAWKITILSTIAITSIAIIWRQYKK